MELHIHKCYAQEIEIVHAERSSEMDGLGESIKRIVAIFEMRETDE